MQCVKDATTVIFRKHFQSNFYSKITFFPLHQQVIVQSSEPNYKEPCSVRTFDLKERPDVKVKVPSGLGVYNTRLKQEEFYEIGWSQIVLAASHRPSYLKEAGEVEGIRVDK
jgi:hypothetical protein